jgi:4'-phosphopantetheinyl transferase EntD
LFSVLAPAEAALPGANPARSSELLATLFASSAIACELRENADFTLLLPEEAGSCGSFRPKRLADFAAGRLCARRALRSLGFAEFALRSNADRTPRWPDGVVGSITHTIGFCGAVVDRSENVASLGLDAEIVAGVVPEVWAEVLTDGELLQLAALPAAERERHAALAFSAKEAFYKCQFGLTGTWLDFRDVTIEAQAETPQAGTFVVRPASSAGEFVLGDLTPEGRYRFDGALVVTGLELSHDAPQRLLPHGRLRAV